MNAPAPTRRLLNRLNPVAKIIGPLPAMIAVVALHDVARPAALIMISLLLIGTCAELRGRQLLLLIGLPLLIFALSVSFGLWTAPSAAPGGTVLLQIGDWHFSTSMWRKGATIALRLGGLLCLSLIAGMTMTGGELTRAMVQQLHIPYRIGYTAIAAARFVPRLRDDHEVIRSAHRARGSVGGPGPIGWLRRQAGYPLPLLAGSIRHAERVALAMDARGFGAYPERTERTPSRYRTRDSLFIVGFWVGTAAVLILLPRLISF